MTLEWPIKPPRVWRTLLWLTCWLSPLALAQAPWPLPPSAPLLGGFITESRVLYPLRIGDWQARSERRYDDPAAGVSIRYEDPQQPGRWMDVYFYPVGVLAEEQVAEIAADTLQELLTLPSRPESDYVRMQAGKLRAQGVKGEPARQAWRAVLQIDTANESYRSGLGLMFKDLYLLKVRISVPAAQMSAAVMEKKLRTLLADIDAHSAVVSTGDCWNPLPIVARPALRAGAEGGLLEHASNGQLQAVAFADRVEALDENSDAAQLMALLGASLSGRLVAGCVPGEDINPVVPEDGREIRLEYPRQRATDAPTGGRLDPARVTRPLLRPRVGADGYPAIARRSASTSG